MLYLVATLTVLLIIIGPNIWVRHILKKHHKPMPMPGTGGELAKHLLIQYKLNDVHVEQSSKDNDHYNPAENTVCLSPEVYNGKSLSAIAVAAHEVGHAIQFNRKEAVSLLRDKYLNKAHQVQHYGIYILMSLPIAGAIFGIPHLALLTALIGVCTMLASVLMYAAILPEEWDASFNKALPILEKGEYVPPQHIPAIRQILKACALTYVAASLADILRLWRWLTLIR
ncbi:MAG: zinc metallopeptidase [Spongiibacteraceae bacterium]|nr:zinc metallopeptidase [Spongiibacteraceae bacterium]